MLLHETTKQQHNFWPKIRKEAGSSRADAAGELMDNGDALHMKWSSKLTYRRCTHHIRKR